jgi:Asp-tRNA(Asn)/Glu-tRNA(Gln) amidotransferase A subunit family amidase
VNNIIEYTWNPKNRHLAAGGSSGGEGALIALKGSPVGFGTDIGGSIRFVLDDKFYDTMLTRAQYPSGV